jgi:hypothetical protein
LGAHEFKVREMEQQVRGVLTRIETRMITNSRMIRLRFCN